MPDLFGKGMGWLRHHDRYEETPATGSCCGGGKA
jgi:hypothetical protein